MVSDGKDIESARAASRVAARKSYYKHLTANREKARLRQRARYYANLEGERKKKVDQYHVDIEKSRKEQRVRGRKHYYKDLEGSRVKAREERRERYYADVEKSRQKNRVYLHNNREAINARARAKNRKQANNKSTRARNPVSWMTKKLEEKIRARNIEQYGAPYCYLCWQYILGERGNLEHLIPVSRYTPGLDPHSEENLDIAHAACNARKGNMTPSEYWKSDRFVRPACGSLS